MLERGKIKAIGKPTEVLQQINIKAMQVLHEIIERETGYKLQSTEKIYFSGYHRHENVDYCIIILLFCVLFLPWTQNIRATGTVTTLYQDQRPQQLNAIIPGRIVKWYVKEGDFVKKAIR